MSEKSVIGFDDVRARLAAGERALLLVRHAERPHIDHDDPTFGAALELTANGRQMSEAFGRALKGAAREVQFRASPLRRTVMTAECIAAGMGLAGRPIVEHHAIGTGSAFFADPVAVWQLFRDRFFFDHTITYLQKGEQTGFAPLGPATDTYERYVTSLFTAQLALFVTHDVFIAAYLHGKGVKTDFNADNWPRFLDTAAIFIAPDGRRDYAFLRAGLSDRATGV